jgi:hypothetical protein
MQKLILRIFFFVFLVSGTIGSSAAETSSEKSILNFSQNWLRYDKFYESYLPLKSSDLKTCKSIHQSIQIEKYRNYDLSFYAVKGLTVFVNNQLIYKKISGEEENIHIPLSTIPFREGEEVIITFYHSKGELPFYTAAITRKINLEESETNENNHLLFLRNTGENTSAYLVLFIFIVTLFVTFKQTYPKEYMRYYSIRLQESTDHLLPGSFSIPSLWMAIMNGLALSLLVYLLNLDTILFNSSLSLVNGTLYIVGLYLVFYIGKYFYLTGIAWLFNYSKVVSSQFAEYIRLFEICCLLSMVCIFGLESSGFIKLNIKPEILYYSLIIVLIFCVIKVIFLFFRLITHRNLYLFSYICAAEILPLIIAVKILLF